MLVSGAGLPIEQTRRRVGTAIEGTIVTDSVVDASISISADLASWWSFRCRLSLREGFGDSDGYTEILSRSGSCVISLDLWRWVL